MLTGKNTYKTGFPASSISDMVELAGTGTINVSQTTQAKNPATGVVTHHDSVDGPDRFTGVTSLRDRSGPFGDSMLIKQNTSKTSKVGLTDQSKPDAQGNRASGHHKSNRQSLTNPT